MKMVGILIGIAGALLFTWHAVKVVMGTDIDTGYMSHTTLSLLGGILVLVGTGIYTIGRRSARRH